jgi:hypothetical protein
MRTGHDEAIDCGRPASQPQRSAASSSLKDSTQLCLHILLLTFPKATPCLFAVAAARFHKGRQ